jgi:hypothetical protein
MAWIESKVTKDLEIVDPNAALKLLEGELSDEDARITLCEFLRNNLKFTTFLLAGIRLAPYQSILINSWMKRNFCLNVLGRGCGKSVLYHNDTRVFIKDRGLISLPKLFPSLQFKEEEYWLEFPTKEIWNGTGWQKINKILVQSQKDCMRITTQNGYSLGGSTRHLIKIYDPTTSQIKWKKYSDIQIGDMACISTNAIPAPKKDLVADSLISIFDEYGNFEKDRKIVYRFSCDKEDLAKETQLNLLAFGIFSEKKRTEIEEWVLTISDKYVDIFLKNLYFAPTLFTQTNGSVPDLDELYFFDPIVKIDSFVHDCVDFNVPTGEMYWSNGFISHNTFAAGIFALLYAIFNPGDHILVVSATFRSSRRILEAIEKLANSEAGALLAQCFSAKMSKKADMYSIGFGNGAMVSAVPLGNSEKLRGLRCTVLILDEALLIPKNTIETILMPFLTASAGITEKMRIRSIEDRLIKKGLMKEEDRKEFKSKAKIISLSSASYTFDYLFEMYSNYLNKVDKGEDEGKYFVSQLSYEVVPKDLLDSSIIKDMTDGSMSEKTIDRELRAQFISDSSGFFSAKKMKECTIADGLSPCIEIVGKKEDKYILAIDPNFSSAEDSDNFAMCLAKIIYKDDRITPLVVHNYAVAGGDLKDHMIYFHYLMTNFNVVYIAIDSSGGDEVEFINFCNESKLFKDNKIELSALEADFAKDDMSNLAKEIKESYNLTIRRIVQKQHFGSNFQRAANEYLQGCFDNKRIYFAAKLAANDHEVKYALNKDVSFLSQHSILKDMSVTDFIEYQDELMDQVKKECALIQIKINALGSTSFGLPMKRTTNPNRPRKDSYSALFLMNWAAKLYHESRSIVDEKPQESFPYQLI